MAQATPAGTLEVAATGATAEVAATAATAATAEVAATAETAEVAATAATAEVVPAGVAEVAQAEAAQAEVVEVVAGVEVAPAAEVVPARQAGAATQAEAAQGIRAANPPAAALTAATREGRQAAATTSPDLASDTKQRPKAVVSGDYGSNVTGISTMWSGSPFSALDSNTWIEPRCLWSTRNRTLVR
jgi:hypothetical protein